MPHRIAIVIPALDEAESLPGVLADLPRVDRVVVVDNGSRDATPDIARRSGAMVVQAARRGYGTAILAGIRALESDPPDILVILDGDHADRPDLLARLVEPIVDDRADMVLSDRSRTAEPGALTSSQRYGNWLATKLIRLVSGHCYRDMGPFRAIRWASLRDLGMEDPTWGWNVEMQIKAVRRGLRILEVPMPYRRRAAGQSKISGTLSGTARAGARILWAVGRYARG
jgi:glycosyltransferase involved in cell wall biosynthesis